jgi:hypothetical protein
MWREGGTPLYEFDERRWNDLKEIVMQYHCPSQPEEGRLIAFPADPGFMLCYCFPEKDGRVLRIDVTSIVSNGEFVPGEINGVPAVNRPPSLESKEHHSTLTLDAIASSRPGSFELSVLTPVKNQGQYGTCTGHAASSTMDWWTCGDVCYLGTGDSKEYSCLCEKGTWGECECIVPMSRQWFYDRFRVLSETDCRVDCPGTNCPSDGGECLQSPVTSGTQCLIRCDPGVCEGVKGHHSQHVFVYEGGCTEECSPYGCDPGCHDGGRTPCTGDCPGVDGPCGDDFRLASSFILAREDTSLTALALYRRGAILAASDICECWWGGHGCLCPYPCPCDIEGGHWYVYYGYNEEEAPNRYYFQNSWGETWGKGGRGELSYGYHATPGHGRDTYGFTGNGPGTPVIRYRSHEFDDSAGNDNGRPDPGESIEMSLTVRNIGEDSSSLTAVLTTNDPAHITVIDSLISFPPVPHNTDVTSSGTFSFAVHPDPAPHWVTFRFVFREEGEDCCADSIEAMIGRPALLFVDDDGGDVYNSWYSMELDSLLNRIFDTWSVETKGSIPLDELSWYETVIWYTGLATEHAGADTANLKVYLSQGGNLFLSGQNIGRELGETSFYRDILHAEFAGDNSGQYMLVGTEGDPLGDGLELVTAGPGGANNCYSPSEVNHHRLKPVACAP